MAKQSPRFKCPECNYVGGWASMQSHFQQEGDDAHIDLESKVERATVNAYLDAEREIIRELCEEVE